MPFLIGGAFALESYTGLVRRTKDLDIFVRPGDCDRLLSGLRRKGYRAEFRFPHWLGKAFKGGHFIDVVFNSGNGICKVDDRWFDHAMPGDVLAIKTNFVPPEEMIWSKAFIMERERYDGGDIAHLFRLGSVVVAVPYALASVAEPFGFVRLHLPGTPSANSVLAYDRIDAPTRIGNE